MQNEFLGVITIVLFLFIAILFFRFLYTLLEYYYGLLTNKPFYVHLYFKIKELTPDQEYVLHTKTTFYNTLSVQHKKYFAHRVAVFIRHYNFIGKDSFAITEEVKVLIASVSVMLTFGMRHYLFKVIDTIVVYPSAYYSTVNENFHKGEFNPRMRAVVFSWGDFISGYGIANDNLNLGLHEFAHVLHFESLKKQNISAIIFIKCYNRIQKEVNHPPNKQRLINNDYFRIYAYTNAFEFLAVLLEHFFETPEQFKTEFPELYKNVATMINFQGQ